MINQFRTINPVNILLLLIVAVLIRVGMLFNLPESLNVILVEPYTGVLLQLPADFFSSFSSVFYALIISVVQALILNHIVNRYNLLPKPTFLPALMYVTLTALITPFIVLSPVLIANFFLLWLIEKFLSIYRKDHVIAVAFDMGMIVGAGTLVYFPFIAMLLLLWIVLLIFRPFNWREWVSGIIGFLTICLFLAVLNYLNDSWSVLSATAFPFATAFPNDFPINLYDYTVLVPVIGLSFLSFLTISQKLNRSNVHVRKSYLTLLFMFLFAALSFYIKSEYNIYHFILTLPPLAIFLAHYFISAQKRWFYESLYLVLIGCIVYFQIF